MIKFLLKTLSYLLVSATIIFAVNYHFLEQRRYDWGEWDHFRNRLSYVHQNDDQINALFVGSSKTRHHIMPKVFDSLCVNTGISSYNLGSNGMFAPATYKIAEELLLDENIELDYLLIEFGFVQDLQRYMGSEKSYYWITPSYWSSTMSMLYHSDLSNEDKLSLSYQYSKILVNKYMSFGELTMLDRRNLVGIDKNLIDEKNLGYNSLENDLKINKTKSLLKSRDVFLKDTTLLSTLYEKQFSKNLISSNAGLSKTIQEILNVGNEKGVQVIFVLQSNGQIEEIKNVFNEIPVENKIDLSQVPEFYQADYHFDNGHLNDNGARLFTIKLYEQFAKIINVIFVK